MNTMVIMTIMMIILMVVMAIIIIMIMAIIMTIIIIMRITTARTILNNVKEEVADIIIHHCIGVEEESEVGVKVEVEADLIL
jgi:hypothetical protein